MKIIVCGSRDYAQQGYLESWLDRFHSVTPVSLLIYGGATGADRLAATWATKNDIPTALYPAQWKSYGLAAGPIRNAQMLLERPDRVIAFPGGKGTANMIKQAKRAGFQVIKV
ncbi:DUF2493 domain-containing protein [Pararobbsia alpina]|uniref:YspA cpYpsA-related SLOG domain-containing protein n=1 Tax=Pararobbsia alpina TaxID=621374 RepID=A0A6S7BGI2_9BURK|nr:hypothetical protein LMG28138_04525 [Pararobbsia alpina]